MKNTKLYKRIYFNFRFNLVIRNFIIFINILLFVVLNNYFISYLMPKSCVNIVTFYMRGELLYSNITTCVYPHKENIVLTTLFTFSQEIIVGMLTISFHRHELQVADVYISLIIKSNYYCQFNF